MKTKRKLTLVAVLATMLMTSAIQPPNAIAQPEKKAQDTLAPLIELSREFNVPTVTIQQELYKGYMLDDVRKGLEAAKKSKKSLAESLVSDVRPSFKNPTKDVKPKVVDVPASSEQNPTIAQQRLQAALLTTGDASVSAPNLDARFNQAPFTVPSGEGSISPLTGSTVLGSNDLTVNGRNGLNFTLTRNYDSNSAQLYSVANGDLKTRNQSYEDKMFGLGAGWLWNIPSVEVKGSEYIYHMQNGVSYTMDPYQNYKLKGYPWSDITIAKGYISELNASGYRITSSKDQVSYIFDLNGKLKFMKDLLGNSITFTWETVNLRNTMPLMLTKVQTSAGNTMTIKYTDLEYTMTVNNTWNPTVQTLKYKFSKNDYTLQGNTVISYYALNEIVDPVGRSMKYDYEVRDAWMFANGATQGVQNPFLMLSKIYYPTGASATYKYASTNSRISATGAMDVYVTTETFSQMPGDSTSYNHYQMAYNGDMYRLSGADNSFTRTMTNDLGNTTVYKYQADSDPTYKIPFTKLASKTGTQGNRKTTISYTYSDTRKLPSPDKTTTMITDLSNPNSTTTTETKQSFDAWGNVVSSTNEVGVSVTNEYDSSYHWLTKTTTNYPNNLAKSKVVKLDHNAPAGKVTGLIYSYKVTDAVNPTTPTVLQQKNYTYDAYGNVTKEDVLETGGKVISSSMTYDPQNLYLATKTTSQTDPDAVKTSVTETFQYDGILGLPTKIMDSLQHETSFAYDALGRLITTTYPGKKRTTSLLYDDLQNTVMKIENDTTNATTPKQLSKSFNRYDALGRQIQQGIGEKVIQKNSYDTYGRQIRREDAVGNGIDYTYDNEGHQSAITLGATPSFTGYTTSTVYNDVAHTKKVTDPDGDYLQETYDGQGHLLQKETNGNQIVSKMEYDLLGNLMTQTDANQKVTTYEYNVLSQLTSVKDHTGGITKYAYDMRGNVITSTYPDGKDEKKSYDENGNLSTFTDANLKTEKYYYDNAHNLIKKIDRNKNVFAFEYNELGYMTKNVVSKPTVVTSADTDNVKFDYDLLGHRTTMTDSTGTTKYSFTPDFKLATVTFPDNKSVSYAYNENGSRNKITDPTGKDTYYKYDGLNQLSAVTLDNPNNKPEASYTYTPGGKLSTTTQGNDLISTFNYDTMGRISMIDKSRASTFSSSFKYRYDPIGNMLNKQESGNVFDYTYDDLSRVKTSSQFNENYSYDQRGNRLTQGTEAPEVVPTAVNYTYDLWGRLAKAVVDGKTVSYKYNGDGMLYERTDGTKTSRYYYDNKELVAEADVVSNVPVFKARYVRGVDLVARLDESPNATPLAKKAYYLTNSHGDVINLIDINGGVLNQYTYDLWGKPVESSEKVQNSLQYASEYWDGTTKIQYLRARWYDPSQGRFLTEDTEKGQVDNPQTLNRYAYVLNNPLTNIDPTGHWCESADGKYKHYGPCADEANKSRESADAGHKATDIRHGDANTIPSSIFILVHGINNNGEPYMQDSLGKQLEHDYKSPVFNFNYYKDGFWGDLGAVLKEKWDENGVKSAALTEEVDKLYKMFNYKEEGIPIYFIAHSGGAVLAETAAINLNKLHSTQVVSRIVTIGGANGTSTDYTYNISGNGDPVADLTHISEANPDTYKNSGGIWGAHRNYFDAGDNFNTTYQLIQIGLLFKTGFGDDR